MKYESNNFQFEAEMPWESAGEGIVRQIMGYNDNLMMVKVKFEIRSNRNAAYTSAYANDLCSEWCVRVHDGR